MIVKILYIFAQVILPTCALVLIMVNSMCGIKHITKQYPLMVAIVMLVISINILVFLGKND